MYTLNYQELCSKFEKEVNTGANYSETLSMLSRAIVSSALKKIDDKTDDPIIKSKRQSLMVDCRTAERSADVLSDTHDVKINQDGEYELVVKSDCKSRVDTINSKKKYWKDTVGDTFDLVQTASLALLEEVAEQLADGNDFSLTRVKVERTLDKRVYIQDTSSAKLVDKEVMPIQVVYRKVRAVIASEKHVQDKSVYTYTEWAMTDDDGVSYTAYKRNLKYADVGGNVCDFNGSPVVYTADDSIVDKTDDIIDAMQLTERQALVLKYLRQGYGIKAIASYLGCSHQAVAKIRKQIQAKAEKVGLTV